MAIICPWWHWRRLIGSYIKLFFKVQMLSQGVHEGKLKMFPLFYREFDRGR